MTDLHPWQVLASEQLLDYSPPLRVLRQTVKLPNGHILHDYVLTPGRDYSMVVALTDDDQVLLVQQYKHGLGRVVYDFPAGYLETPDEGPLAAAQRELLEETGYVARRWTRLGAYHLDTNRREVLPLLHSGQMSGLGCAAAWGLPPIPAWGLPPIPAWGLPPIPVGGLAQIYLRDHNPPAD